MPWRYNKRLVEVKTAQTKTAHQARNTATSFTKTEQGSKPQTNLKFPIKSPSIWVEPRRRSTRIGGANNCITTRHKKWLCRKTLARLKSKSRTLLACNFWYQDNTALFKYICKLERKAMIWMTPESNKHESLSLAKSSGDKPTFPTKLIAAFASLLLSTFLLRSISSNGLIQSNAVKTINK